MLFSGVWIAASFFTSDQLRYQLLGEDSAYHPLYRSAFHPRRCSPSVYYFLQSSYPSLQLFLFAHFCPPIGQCKPQESADPHICFPASSGPDTYTEVPQVCGSSWTWLLWSIINWKVHFSRYEHHDWKWFCQSINTGSLWVGNIASPPPPQKLYLWEWFTELDHERKITDQFHLLPK